MQALDIDLGALLDWVWQRHHHPASWYVRPLFLLPFCWFAWHRSVPGLLLTLLLFPTTLAWFPPPAGPPDPALAAYLEAERRMLSGSWAAPAALALAAVAFLGLLAWTLWRRSAVGGLLVLHLGTAAKVAWSLWAWGPTGQASVAPAVFTLVACDLALLAAWRWRRRRTR